MNIPPNLLKNSGNTKEGLQKLGVDLEFGTRYATFFNFFLQQEFIREGNLM